MEGLEKKRKKKLHGKRPPKFDHRKKFGAREKYSSIIENEIRKLNAQYEETVDTDQLKTFSDIPLSQKTQKGLKESNYVSPTEIQRESVIHALRGNDILGAAKTGSGKTLAFLIPVLETLYRCKWNKFDGLGALVVSPTRELAYQIFEVLRKVGKFHDFSAGLVIGGKFIREEAERITNTNIVICTPGRLLQHMDETAYFNADNLQILVLDEADRCLDLGFQKTMNAIIQNLPKRRQTLLFSATQTKSVKDLARLSLKDPVYVSVHEHSLHSTPSQLQQSYMVCDLHQKLDLLWSFVKNHLKSKILVFIQSCKQVRFIYEIFRRLRPGTTVLCLHGAMKQLKRMEVYDSFCRKENAVMFATDIASRGLDFPAVNWVVQLDCPEDANTYIHRAGRTARYQEDGEALLILLPSEEDAMVQHLREKKIPIDKIKVNPKKVWSVQPRIESFCAAEVELKEFAQRAFVAYLKSVFLMKDKMVFDVSSLDTDKYAHSMGLAIPPRIRFLKKHEKFSQQVKLDLSTQQLISKLTGSAPKDSVAGKLPDSGNESNAQSESDDSEDTERNESESAESEDSEFETEQSTIKAQFDSNGTFLKSKMKSNVTCKSGKIDPENSCSENESGNDNSEDSEYNESEDSDEDYQSDHSKKSNKLNFDIGNEDLDDILTIKKQHTEELEGHKSKTENNIKEVLPGKKTKVLTKTALAKKALKKNIQVNMKVVFDDEGEEVYNPVQGKKIVTDSDDDLGGGIDLEKAKERMREEDKKDKEIYRQRVKVMHRDKRIKEKERKRGKKEKKDEDDSAGEEVALDSQEGSALDFIPDPDEIYGHDNSSESDDERGMDEGPPSKKRRKLLDQVEIDSEGSNEDDSDEGSEEEDITKGMSLTDQESWALKLLS